MTNSERILSTINIFLKKRFGATIIVFCISMMACVPAYAQLSANLSGGYGFPTQPGSGGILGGGVGIKYYLTSTIAVGARVRTYLETVKESSNSLDGRLTSATVPIMGTFEYQFILAHLHPYVGMEAGIIRSALDTRLNYNGREVYNESMGDTSLGIAPKIGVGYDLTQGMSLMAEALYNVGFGKNQSGNTQLDLKQTTRFLSIHLGISLTFGSRF